MNEVFMKTRFFALCTALVLTLTLSGCWQDVEEPDTSQTLLEELGDQSEQESPRRPCPPASPCLIFPARP